jgi:hypothetical protein
MKFVSHAPTLLTAPVFVVAVLYVSVVIGRRVLQVLRVGRAGTHGERFVIAGALGLGLLQFVPFVLGTIGILSETSVRIVLAAIAIASLWDLRSIIAELRDGWSKRSPVPAWEWVWFALLAAPLVISFFYGLAPSFDPDGVGYHLAAPKQWLTRGSLDYLPTLMYTHGVAGTEMLYASSLAVVGDAGAKLLHFGASLLAAGGVFLLGARVGARTGGRIVGFVACTLFLFAPTGIYSVISASYAEGTATLAVVASALCWMLWFDSSDRTWLRGAALLAGIAVTFKLTSVVFPVALLALTVLIVRRRGREATGMAGMTPAGGVGLAALLVVPMVPWMIRSALITGNPVFPVLARWIPSKNLPPGNSEIFETYNRYMIWGTRAGYDLSLDARKVVVALVALAILACGVFVYLRQKDPVHRLVTVVLVPTLIVQLYAAGLYMRYWTPLAAVLQIPILAFVFSRINERVARAGLLVILALFATGKIHDWVRSDPAQYVAASVDASKREELHRELVPLLPLYETANDQAAPGEAVLFGYGCAAFYIDGPPMCAETLETSLRLDDWDSFNRDLETLGIRYVIVPRDVADGVPPPETEAARAVGDVVRPEEYTMLNRLLRTRGQLIASALDQGLYRIAPSPGDQTEA